MFKKPLHKLFTSTALRNSDVKALRTRVVELFPAAESVVDELVPKGIMTCKFDTHLDETGVLYLSAEKEPLWFAMGREPLPQKQLIPTVYTLWKRPSLLPMISTPSAVIPVLVGGADLMIPGVVPSPILPTLSEGQLVAITQYKRSTPLIIGSMAIAGTSLREDEDQKGKAVVTLHAMGDALWALGSKREPPDATDEPDAHALAIEKVAEGVEQLDVEDSGAFTPRVEDISERQEPQSRVPTPQEVETTLRATTLYVLSRLETSLLPMPASTFYSSHILPSRPARPVLPENSLALPVPKATPGSSRSTSPLPDPAEASTPSSIPTELDPKVFLAHLDIKHTPQKKLAPFLKTIEKDGIIKLKDVRGELLIFSADIAHPALIEARKWGWKTVGAEKEREAEINAAAGGSGLGQKKEVTVEEVWFPEASTTGFFEACGESAQHYTLSDLRTLLNQYVTSHNLQHPANPKYVVLDEVLSRPLLRKGEDPKEFVERAEMVERLTGNMRGMWRINETGGFKKSPLPPIVITTKARQGRKVVTLITGIEPFAISAEELAEDLRKRCASSTSVSPCAEKPKQIEVMVQGSQTKAVVELLLELGVPKRWISAVEKSGKGKGKGGK
ncbi:hypothetical protein BDV93DRAFT_546886 [Ceratobasidium sp. AG-I]|nr:hypothetical protein BDV93DRAFT_546886 [Ceratobasidium sp. AG-I]